MLLLLLEGKNFGMSANLRTLCSISGAGKTSEFFRFDWKSQRWNLIVVLGAIIGGYIAANHLTPDRAVDINPVTVAELQSLGFESAGEEYLPDELYSANALTQPKTIILLALGGFQVGFGTGYAREGTSGHGIYGLSNVQ